MTKILSIDPSGTGRTGLYLWKAEQSSFAEYQSPNWKEHLAFIRAKIEQHQPNIILYEHTNYIGIRGKDMTSLFKLFGAIETLPLFLSFITQISPVPVHQVKGLKQVLLKGSQIIPGLTYQLGRGQGWKWEGKKISVHQLDALLVYHLWKNKSQQSVIYRKIISK